MPRSNWSKGAHQYSCERIWPSSGENALKLTLDLAESLPYLATDIRCAASLQYSDGLNDFS